MRLATGFLVFLMPLLFFPPASTADSANADPALGVARLSVVSGDVAAQRGDSGDWVAAAVNMPLVEGDSLQTKGASRAEVQLAHGNFVRVNGDTDIQFLELARQRFRVRLSRGTAIYSELEGSEADIDIETAVMAVRPMEAGRFRVSVTPDATVVEVRQGKTEIAFQNFTTTLSKGESMTIREGPGGLEFKAGSAGSADSFDRWAASRDRTLRRAISYKYVSRDIYGAASLDGHGAWRFVIDLGYCWFPRVSAGWVPYRHGRWLWLDYYGWTWVGNEPWGWAPYHWGRWQNHSVHGWGWFPGPTRLRHAWRPALVAFFGFQPAVSARVWAGFGGIGWAPLAPGERYSPWYGGRYYGRNTIVVDNSVRVFNTYSNARDRRAVSYIDSRRFALGSTHTPRALRTSEIREAAAIRGPLPVVPDRASQGRVLRASDASPGSGTLQSLRRGHATRLRDGTARISFEDQRNRIQNSVEAFHRGYRNHGATVASNSSVRSRRNPAGTGPAVVQGPATRPAVPRVTPVPAVGPVPAPGTQRRGGIASTGAPQTVLGPSSALTVRSPVSGSQPAGTAGSPSVGAAGASGVGPVAAPSSGTRRTPGRLNSANSSSRNTTNPPRPSGRLGTSVRITEQSRPSGQGRSSSSVPSAIYPTQSTRVPGSVPSPPEAGFGGPYRGTTVGTPASVYAPRTGSRTGTTNQSEGSRGGGTRSRPTTRTGASPAPPAVSRPTAPSPGQRRVQAPRPGTSSSTSVYAPRSRSRVGTYQVPGTSSRAPSAGQSRVPSSSSRSRSRVSPSVPSGSRGGGSSRPSAPSVRTPRSSSRSSSGGGTFGNQRRSRSAAPTVGSGGRVSPRSSSSRSTAPRVGGLSTDRSSRVGSSGPRMSSPRPSSGPSRRSSGGSRRSYGGSRGSSSRPSGSYRPGSSARRGASSSSSRPKNQSDR